mmetsp:Transcript_9233/g.10671  ORF Transcript_9233/g.10671 Transcript_9233/m.10671 type:complete len:168 (+) Transcript_9233:219-722(+)|eukprot:CAMPEP_0197844656 /NCGR_PEP_ID=MMETSP1438-20131217/1652_1 /TAXON_ID=1461541 /ORGANISM="Pterosperma sp., Strain CCMP1384" /LENGTH=167 /DNA_ID=CAMNT_0043455585 /DNA_START=219 /DNA_END=722 /DNA_ORIENTATION=-
MKPAWDALMAEYKDHATVLIADVDCTAAGKALCETHGVRGYPTIKYGDPSNLEDYKGGRSEKDLKDFAKTLKPMCSPANIDLCEGDQKKQIEELMALSATDLDAKIAEKEKLLKDAEETFNTELEKLQKAYEGLQKDKEAIEAEVKDSGLGLMKAVKAAAGKSHGEL